jgi:PAS domain S-box-containing protein
MKTSDERRSVAALSVSGAEEQRSGEPGWRAVGEAMAPAIVWTARADGAVTAATGWEAATGLPEASVLGRGWLGALHPEDRPRAEAGWAAATAGGGAAAECDLELRFRDAGGRWRWRHLRGTPVRDPATGAVREWVVVAQDVEGRVQAEAALAAGEAAWLALVEATPGLVFVADAEGNNLFTNRRYQRYSGLQSEALLGDGWLATLHPEDRARAAEIWAASVRTGEPYEAEYRFLRADGEARWHVVRGTPQRNPATGRIARWVGTCTDVDDSRRAEAANARLAAIVASTSDAVISFDAADGRILTWNRGAEALFGYTAEEAISGPVGLLVPADLPDGDPTGVFRWAMEGRRVHEHETARVAKSGERIPVSVTAARMVAPDGRVFGVSAIFRDLRPRRAAEAALRDSEAFLRSVLDASTDCLKVVDAEGRLEFMNANGQCLMEIQDFGPLQGAEWAALWPEAGQEQVREAVATALSGRPARFEAFCPTAQGTPKWWDVAVAPVRDAAGRVLRLVSSSRDVTGRKEAEAALARSETRLRAALDAIPQMVWSTRPDGYHDYYNRRWYEFTGAAPEQVEGGGWNPQFHPEDRERAWARWRHSLETGEPYEIEYRLRAADGSYRWVLGRALPVRDPQTGAIARWYGTCTEIDELLATRAALAEALEVKDALLHEVNHRVKNSLQLVSSLLTLQASRGRDPGLRAALGEARARIGVVARLHQRLYQAGTHGRVELVGFLRELCADAAAALGAGGEGRVRLVFQPPADTGQLLLPIDRAVPLALVASELLTNALKYAFPPDHAGGTVRLALQPPGADGGALAVLVEDDGVGLPEDFDPAAAGSVGMRVVSVLARQLGAELRFGAGVSGAGAAFELRMPEPGT